MLIIKAIIGAIFLFLGQELNFFIAAAMAALIGLRLTPLLPRQWPEWSNYVFMLTLALVAAGIVNRKERIGYFVSGFLTGGYLLVEYYEPGFLTLPLLPFLVGGTIGSMIVGLFTDWALIILSCLVGAFFLIDVFNVSSTAEILIGSGLFIIGALTQVILRRMQKNDD